MIKLYGEEAILYAAAQGLRVQLYYAKPETDGRGLPRAVTWHEVQDLAASDPGGLSCEVLPAPPPEARLEVVGEIQATAPSVEGPTRATFTAYAWRPQRGLPS